MDRQGMLPQHAGKSHGKGVRIAGPSRRNIVAIPDYKSRRRIAVGIAFQARGLAAIVRIIPWYIAKIPRSRERTRYLLLHRHKTLRLPVLFRIGPVIVR